MSAQEFGQPSSQREGRQGLDIGLVIQAPMQDPDWLKKCALMGLMSFAICLIPIAGYFLAVFNAMGWMKTYAEGRLRGDSTIPDVGLKYLGAGWRMFLMYLPAFGVMILVELLVFGGVALGVAVKVPALSSIFSILGSLVLIPLVLWLSVMGPGILYLHVVKGEPWASLQVKKQWRLMMAGGTDYLLFWVAILVAGIIGELGFIACGLGLFVSLPFAGIMYGAAIAEFEKAAGDRTGAAL